VAFLSVFCGTEPRLVEALARSKPLLTAFSAANQFPKSLIQAAVPVDRETKVSISLA
jgi:hypothetical protein